MTPAIDPPELHHLARRCGQIIALQGLTHSEAMDGIEKVAHNNEKIKDALFNDKNNEYRFSLLARLEETLNRAEEEWYENHLRNAVNRLVSARTPRDDLHIQAGRIAGDDLPASKIKQIVGQIVNEWVCKNANKRNVR